MLNPVNKARCAVDRRGLCSRRALYHLSTSLNTKITLSCLKFLPDGSRIDIVHTIGTPYHPTYRVNK